MNTIQMTVTQALRERKILKDRISRATNEGIYLALVEGDAQRPVNKAFRTHEELAAKIQSSTDSVNGLIKRYHAIVDALISSNANTTVTVAGQTLTVAAAIERRTSNSMTKEFLVRIGVQQAGIVREMDSRSRILSQSIEARIAANKTDSMDATQVAQLAADSKAVLERESMPKIFDPANILSGYDKMRSDFDAFEDELETQLNIINATTMIEIPA